MRLLLGPGRKDESGDFTDGVKLSDSNIDAVISFLTSTVVGDSQQTCDNLLTILGETENGKSGIDELIAISRQIPDEYKNSVATDCSIIRGLEYYTGPVFEADLTFEAKDKKRPAGCAWGRLAVADDMMALVERFKGVRVPGVGISVGVSRLLAALALKNPESTSPPGPIVVLALEKDQMAAYQEMAAELRGAGLRAEVYVGGSKFRQTT